MFGNSWRWRFSCIRTARPQVFKVVDPIVDRSWIRSWIRRVVDGSGRGSAGRRPVPPPSLGVPQKSPRKQQKRQQNRCKTPDLLCFGGSNIAETSGFSKLFLCRNQVFPEPVVHQSRSWIRAGRGHQSRSWIRAGP